MRYTDFSLLCEHKDFKEFAKNEWLHILNEPGQLDMRIYPGKLPSIFKDIIWKARNDNNAIGYYYILNELYIHGMKCIKPTLEQCLAFEQIEINIPFKEYRQSYENIVVEYPEEYCRILVNRYKSKAPIAFTCHRPNNKEYMIGALSFGITNYNITVFITNNDVLLEELIKIDHETDPDYLPCKDAERVAFNTLLFMTNFGFNRVGYENVKQHRFRERKQPLLAKQDAYYFSLKQDIKIYDKKIIKKGINTDGTHASPKCHWRRGHWRLQHYGVGNQQVKTIFIKAVFVCSEHYKGDMSNTEITYQGTKQ